MSDRPTGRQAAIAGARRDLNAFPALRAAADEAKLAIARREADDRSWIVKWFVRGFCGYVLLIFVTLGLRAFLPGAFDDAVAIEVELLKTAIMPLMTLVLGYFFSRPNR